MREQGRVMTVYSSLSLKCQSVGITRCQGFLNLSATDILDQMILCCGAALCSVDCSAHLWPPPTRRLLQQLKCLLALPGVPLGKNWPYLRTTMPKPQGAKSPASEVKAGGKLSSTWKQTPRLSMYFIQVSFRQGLSHRLSRSMLWAWGSEGLADEVRNSSSGPHQAYISTMYSYVPKVFLRWSLAPNP